MLLLIHLARCRFLWPYMALILLWVCHRKYAANVSIFTVAAQYILSQDEIDAILHDEELDSYLFTFGEAQKALTIFSLSKNGCSVFSDVFSRKGEVPSKKVRRMLGLEEGKTILDRGYFVILSSIV